MINRIQNKSFSLHNTCMRTVYICYGADETWDVQIHVQSFIQRRGHETGMDSIMANRYNTGKTKSNPRTSVGLRSANNIQQGKATR